MKGIKLQDSAANLILLITIWRLPNLVVVFQLLDVHFLVLTWQKWSCSYTWRNRAPSPALGFYFLKLWRQWDVKTPNAAAHSNSVLPTLIGDCLAICRKNVGFFYRVFHHKPAESIGLMHIEVIENFKVFCTHFVLRFIYDKL